MYFDRFDIVEAWFLALSECHSGQYSREYARLCKLMRKFKPSHALCSDTLSENGKEIYRNACEKLLAIRPW